MTDELTTVEQAQKLINFKSHLSDGTGPSIRKLVQDYKTVLTERDELKLLFNDASNIGMYVLMQNENKELKLQIARQSKGAEETSAAMKKLEEERNLALQACHVVKNFLVSLENGTDLGDPLREIRLRVHRKLHDALDAAITAARKPKERA